MIWCTLSGPTVEYVAQASESSVLVLPVATSVLNITR